MRFQALRIPGSAKTPIAQPATHTAATAVVYASSDAAILWVTARTAKVARARALPQTPTRVTSRPKGALGIGSTIPRAEAMRLNEFVAGHDTVAAGRTVVDLDDVNTSCGRLRRS